MRVLSGIVAVLFLTVLFMQINQLPVPEAALFAVLGCLFAIYAVAAAIVLGVLMWVQHERAENGPDRRHQRGGFYLAVGVPGAEGVVAVGGR